MRLLDAKRIEKPEHGIRKITEGIGTIDAFCRAPVARQVRHNQSEMLCKLRNVADKVGRACRPRSPAVKQEQCRPLSQFGDPDIAACDLDVPSYVFEWKWLHSLVLPSKIPYAFIILTLLSS